MSEPVDLVAPCYPPSSMQSYGGYDPFPSHATSSQLALNPSADRSGRPPLMGSVDPAPLYSEIGVPSDLWKPPPGPAPLISHWPPSTAPPLQHYQQLSQMSSGEPQYNTVVPSASQTHRSETSTPSSVRTPHNSQQTSMYAPGDSKIPLWLFLLELLQSEDNSNLIQWTSKEGEFKVSSRPVNTCVHVKAITQNPKRWLTGEKFRISVMPRHNGGGLFGLGITYDRIKHFEGIHRLMVQTSLGS